MARSLFLFTICLIATVIGSPIMLSATDDVVLTGLNPAGMVETVPLPEPEPEPEPATVSQQTVNYSAGTTAVLASNPVVEPVQNVVVTPNYTVTRYVGSVSEYTSIAHSLSYSDLYKFRKMIYGHNTSALLGSLAYRYPGEVITITENGVPMNYQVMTTAVYQKTADGNLEGDPKLMGNIASTALGYDVALLTCAGTPYGNGDASHRLVVFANRI